MLVKLKSLVELIEAALQSANAQESLIAVARQLQQQGVTQEQLYEAFESVLICHRDSNEAFFDALAAVLDRIVGWCQPEQRLFDTYLSR